MTLAPGTTVGRYQILEPLGQGGMATVYKAFQPSLQREVALKVLRPGYAQDQEFRERFEREAIAIAKLRHPHIVQVFDFEIASSGEYVLAMEFLEGGTLKDRLTKLASEGRGIDPAQSVRIISEVAQALSYAHEKGVIHRDVKPSNVMLTAKDWAVVTDFGIARILGATSHTQTGVGIGTPEYMAPEQGQGAGIDHRADIYSLGAMAYELLTGRVPYAADTPLAVVLAHIKDPLPLPSKVNPTIGKGVERALLRALAKDPAQRFETATAFAEALSTGLAEDTKGGTMPTVVVRGAAPIVAAATSTPLGPLPTRLPQVLAQRPIVAGVATGVIFAMIVGGVVASKSLRSSPQPSNAPSVTGSEAAVVPVATAGAASPTQQASAAAPTAGGTATTATASAAPAPTTAATPGRTVAVTAAPSTASAPPAATIPPTSQPIATVPQAFPTATLPPTPTPYVPPTLDPNAPKYVVGGRVTSAATGGPMSNVNVRVGAPTECCPNLADTVTDASGNYRIGLPNGRYRLAFFPGVSTGHAPKYWGGTVTYGSGRDLVISGQALSGVDAILDTGFAATVRVTTASGGVPSQRIKSDVVGGPGPWDQTDWSRYWIGNGECQTTGVCTIRLPSGTYHWILFADQDAKPFGGASFTVAGRDVEVQVRMPS